MVIYKPNHTEIQRTAQQMTSAIFSANNKNLQSPFSIHRTGFNPMTHMQLGKDAMVLACDPTRKELVVAHNLVSSFICCLANVDHSILRDELCPVDVQVPGTWERIILQKTPSELVVAAVSLAYPALNQ